MRKRTTKAVIRLSTLIRTTAVCQSILQYQINLLVDSVGSDQQSNLNKTLLSPGLHHNVVFIFIFLGIIVPVFCTLENQTSLSRC